MPYYASCEIAYIRIYTPDTFVSRSNIGAHARADDTVTSIMTTAGGINHENYKSALHIRARRLDVRTLHYGHCKTYAQVSLIFLSTIYAIYVASCIMHARSHYRRINQALVGRKRIAVYPLFQRHLQLAIRLCRCSGNIKISI